MIRVVSWNIDKRVKPWRELVEMARADEADVALLQEAGAPPSDVVHRIRYEDDAFWDRRLYDRWPLVVQLTDWVEVEWFRAVEPISEFGEGDIGVSGIGTMAAAREAFVAVSMYARWMKPHPTTGSRWKIGTSDVSDTATRPVTGSSRRGTSICSTVRRGTTCPCPSANAPCGHDSKRSAWNSWGRRRWTADPRGDHRPTAAARILESSDSNLTFIQSRGD